jgi:hypothetical protein
LEEKKVNFFQNFFQQTRRILSAIALILVLTISTACAGPSVATQTPQVPQIGNIYTELARGNTESGQKYGDWVIKTSKGLIKDAYVRDNNKLGVVITSDVKPQDVRSLARSLAVGFHKNFPNQDLTVLVYAPDKKLILTSEYDVQSNQIKFTS